MPNNGPAFDLPYPYEEKYCNRPTHKSHNSDTPYFYNTFLDYGNSYGNHRNLGHYGHAKKPETNYWYHKNKQQATVQVLSLQNSNTWQHDNGAIVKALNHDPYAWSSASTYKKHHHTTHHNINNHYHNVFDHCHDHHNMGHIWDLYSNRNHVQKQTHKSSFHVPHHSSSNNIPHVWVPFF